MKRYFCLIVALLVALTMAASAESSTGSADTNNTSVEYSATGSGSGTGAAAATAETPNTQSEASSAGAGDGASASGAYSSTPSTSAESSSASAGGAGGGASSSSSYSSTTTTTTTTTTSSSSSSSSSSSGSSSGSGTFVDPADPWPLWPPAQPSSHKKSSGSSKTVESIIRTEEVTGKGWTLISKVNVRTMPSIAAGQVVQIRSAGTEVIVTGKALNSSGETWYAVKMYQGYVGYIRSDLLRVEVTEEIPKDTADETIVTTIKNKTNGSPKVIYVIVEPTQAPKEEEEETQIIYITPDQAQEMGIMNGVIDLSDNTNTTEATDGDPVNG